MEDAAPWKHERVALVHRLLDGVEVLSLDGPESVKTVRLLGSATHHGYLVLLVSETLDKAQQDGVIAKVAASEVARQEEVRHEFLLSLLLLGFGQESRDHRP